MNNNDKKELPSIIDELERTQPEHAEKVKKYFEEFAKRNEKGGTSYGPIRTFIGQVTKIRDEANNPKSSTENKNKPQ